MTFNEAVATQPQWVQIWVNILGGVVVASALVLAFSKHTRMAALAIVVSLAGIIPMMLWMYDQFGYVRLLGLPHIIFWTPLVAYLFWRLRDPMIGVPFRQVMWVLIVVLCISLAFDYADVARYLLGETQDLR